MICLPRKVAIVGKIRALQKVLVIETLSEEGGREAAAPLISCSGSSAKAGNTKRVSGARGRYNRRTWKIHYFSFGACFNLKIESNNQ